MKKLLAAIGLLFLVLVSACTVSRTASPISPDSGQNWASQRATHR